MNGHKGNGGSTLWGYSVSFWEWVIIVALSTAAIAGGISVVTGFVAGIVGYRVADVTQRGANERIRVAEQKVKESDERIAVAEQKVAEAKAKAAEADAKAEEQRLRALRIEEKIAPRKLSQTPALIDKLKSFTGITVAIRILIDNNPDGIPFANQLASVLQAAGWQVFTHTAGDEYFRGIMITLSNGSTKETTTAAHMLVSELMSDGILAALGPPNLAHDEPNIIRIRIGIKP